MKGQKAIFKRIMAGWEQAGEGLQLQPLLELCCDRRVLIENHGGVLEYGPERIRVRVRYGILCICGRQLRLCVMSGHQLVIRGLIDEIKILREVCR